MIRIMIVEDEPTIAGSIKLLAENYPSDKVEVVNVSLNGARALSYLENNHVDLIFSDIKMPIMDGLTLASHIHEKYPKTVMVIISGFQEFDFAKKAMQYGVKDYVLKPVSQKGIHDIIDKVADTIKGNNQRLIQEIVNRGDAPEKASDNTETHMCGVILACAGPYPLAPDEIMLFGRDLWDGFDIENLVVDFLVEKGYGQNCVCTSGKTFSEKVILFDTEKEESVEAVIKLMSDRLQKELSIFVTIDGEYTAFNKTGATLTQLRKNIAKHSGLFHSRRLGKSFKSGFSGVRFDNIPLITAVKSQNRDKIKVEIDALVDSCSAQKITQSEFYYFIKKTAETIFENKLELEKITDIEYDIRSAITVSMTPTDLKLDLFEIFDVWISSSGAPSNDEFAHLCEKAAAYIRSHYLDNISTPELAREIGISATQLSRKFNDHFGISIPEFVNKFRIDLAKSILDQDNTRMIKAVAFDVGYNDPYYFSKIFKRVEGIWPKEYLSKKK